MNALLIMLLSFAGYLLMYRLYGRFIGRRIFAIDDSNTAPSVRFEDGVDYVPTRKEVIFGHHLWMQIPISIALGHVIYKRGGSFGLWSLAAVVLMYGTIVLGASFPLAMPDLPGIPAAFMSVMTIWASVLNQFDYGSENNLLLQAINTAIIFIVLWITVEGILRFFRPAVNDTLATESGKNR